MKKHLLICAVMGLVLAGCGDDTNENVATKCGNANVEASEVCDDGNTEDGDGCSADCSSIEDGYQCPEEGGKCEKTEQKTDPEPEPEPGNKDVCGDGKVTGDEVCDDGNTNSNDGCQKDCLLVEDGYSCPKDGGACAREPKCGDGELTGDEVCDDGNEEDGDGCSADCKTIEDGYHCDVPGYDCISELCGNDNKDPGEECDAGEDNVDYGVDSCSKSCKIAHYCGDKLLEAVDIDNGEECDDGADTSANYNGCNLYCKRVNFCGDGKIQSEHEQCDDGNEENGDGCSKDCQFEPNYTCITKDGKSECSPLSCGNGKLDVGEQCDDGNRAAGDGCSMICVVEKGARCETNGDGLSVCTKTCGDGVVDAETGEMCDDGNVADGDGCSSQCVTEPGYVCSGKKCYALACGDGIVAGKEECDDGNTENGDGCSHFCKREEGYHCDVPGQNCEEDKCGDGNVTGDETCDEGIADHPENATPGCVNCKIQMGWKCETAGASCTEAVCGNGIVEGVETCEETSECCEACVIQPFCKCDASGKNCVKGSCGNGILEAGEECDDGNDTAGDGCSPKCKIEDIFSCSDGECKPTCGDGITIWQAGEECDDGNLYNGDGCSSECKIESGYTCTDFSQPNPTQIKVPITYRDFRAWTDGNYSGSGDHNGYLSQELYDTLPAECLQSSGYRTGSFPAVDKPIPDFQQACIGQYCLNTVYDELDKDGKPVLRPASDFTIHPEHQSGTSYKDNLGITYTCNEVYSWWFRDMEGLNIPIKTHLTLTQNASDPDLYEYGSKNFFPILNQGFHAPDVVPRASNSGTFTSEFETYFQYKGGETLVFDGDDDAWVFINNKLAVDMGCMHVSYRSPVTLDEEMAKKLDIYPGGIYSIRMFHAERCSNGTAGSIYQVSLRGFVNMGTSTCDTQCGDGIIRGAEECEFANGEDPNDVEAQHKYGCSSTCQLQPFCGNGVVEAGEGCDTAEEWCKDCKIVTCGDGKFDSEHEQCDPSAPASDQNRLDGCLETCRIAGCGDGVVSGDEECDDGNLDDNDMCTSKCKRPFCGDGIKTAWLGEVCDDGVNDGGYGGCGIGCAYQAPKCGDGIVDSMHGEECDDGEAGNTGGYGKCKADCTLDEHCGDGILQEVYEQCEPGLDSSCTKSCVFPIN